MLVLPVAIALAALEVPTGLADVPPEMPAPLIPSAPAPDDASEPPQPRMQHPYVLTALETTLLLAAGTVWYWTNPSYSDWDLNFDWNSWKSKLTSSREIVFDDNLFNTNSLNHPISGAFFYQVARGNGFNVPSSFLSSFVASTVWEYLAEFNEKPSLNDLILTPVGGAIIGEATYRLGRLFHSGEPGITNCVGAFLFAPIATLNDPVVCRDGRGEPPFDRFGFSRRTWHRVGVELGRTRSVFEGSSTQDETSLGLAADIVAHRPYRRSGEGTTFVYPGQWSLFSLRNLLSDGGGLRGTNFHSHIVLLGEYRRRFAEPAEGMRREPNGRGVMLGLGSSFDYDSRDLPTTHDRTASAGLLGPMVEFAGRRGAFVLRAAFSAQYSFAIVQSLVYPQAADAFASEFIKSPLRQQGYYYAQGVTSSSLITLEAGDFELCLDGRGGWFRSIDSADRYQQRIDSNVELTDMRLFLRATAAARLFGGPLRVALAYDQTYRGSQLPGYVYASTERRTGLAALFVF